MTKKVKVLVECCTFFGSVGSLSFFPNQNVSEGFARIQVSYPQECLLLAPEGCYKLFLQMQMSYLHM